MKKNVALYAFVLSLLIGSFVSAQRYLFEVSALVSGSGYSIRRSVDAKFLKTKKGDSFYSVLKSFCPLYQKTEKKLEQLSNDQKGDLYDDEQFLRGLLYNVLDVKEEALRIKKILKKGLFLQRKKISGITTIQAKGFISRMFECNFDFNQIVKNYRSYSDQIEDFLVKFEDEFFGPSSSFLDSSFSSGNSYYDQGEFVNVEKKEDQDIIF